MPDDKRRSPAHPTATGGNSDRHVCSGRLEECGARTFDEFTDGDCPRCSPSEPVAPPPAPGEVGGERARPAKGLHLRHLLSRTRHLRRRIRFLFAWYDIWIGAYWDRRNRRLYILPIPMFGIVIDCCRHDWKLQRYYTRDNDYADVERCKRCDTETDQPF